MALTSTATTHTPPELEPDDRAGKYLTFLLGPEEFGIPALKVREIVGIQDITAVPQTPKFLRGVINLRGKVIPVVDLRLKFAMPEQPYTSKTCIIVVQVDLEPAGPMGIIVDEVMEVVNLRPTDIEDTPDLGGRLATPGILGLARSKEKVKILLDIHQILSNLNLFTIMESSLQSPAEPNLDWRP